MTTEITATFVRRSFQDSGADQAPDYYVFEFTDIIDGFGKKWPDKWIKETKLMREVSFVRGKEYRITLSSPIRESGAINLPFPVKVCWDKKMVYMKNGNSIIVVDEKGNEENVSQWLSKLFNKNNYETAAFNKFNRGELTPELLEKMNIRGMYFVINYVDPQDKRKTSHLSIGYSRSGNENSITVKQESQEEINEKLKHIFRLYVKKDLRKYFKVYSEILPPKGKKKK